MAIRRLSTGRGFALGMVVLAVAAGCARSPEIAPTSRATGPDEFAIIPNKPLSEPPSFSQLPAPTPGGVNRSDATPRADAISALGGRPGVGVAGPEIVAAATRSGLDPEIRAILAAEDQRYRRARNAFFLTRIFARNRYERVYRRYGLDPWAEDARLEAAGLSTPDAPPRR